MINKVNIIVEIDGSVEATFNSGLNAFAYYTFRSFTGMTSRIALRATGMFEDVYLKDSGSTPIGNLLDFFGKYFHFYDLSKMGRLDFLDVFYDCFFCEDYIVKYIPEETVKKYMNSSEGKKGLDNLKDFMDWLENQEE